MGLRSINADQSTFIAARRSLSVCRDYRGIKVLVYVDDILVLTLNTQQIKAFYSQLLSHFEVTDNGPCSHFLGTDVARSSSGSLMLSQKRCVNRCLYRFGLQGCRSVPTPMDPKLRIQPRPSNDSAP